MVQFATPITDGKIPKPRRTLSNQLVKFVHEGDIVMRDHADSCSLNRRNTLFHPSSSNMEISGRRYSTFIDPTDGFIFAKEDASTNEHSEITKPLASFSSKSYMRRDQIKEIEFHHMTPVDDNTRQEPLEQPSLKRRSSRRRASSLLGSNLYTLHPAVDPSSYYKHISSDLPGPLRMRQLLIWCLQVPSLSSSSSVNSKKGQFDKDVLIGKLLNTELSPKSQEDLIIEGVLEGVVDGLIKKHIQTTWYHVPDKSVTSGEALRPNPANGRIQREFLLLSEFNAKIESELASWDTCISSLSSSTASVIAEASFTGRASLLPGCDFPTDILQSELDSRRILADFHSFLNSFSFKALRFAEDAYHELYTKVVKPLEPSIIGDSIGVLRALSRTVSS